MDITKPGIAYQTVQSFIIARALYTVYHQLYTLCHMLLYRYFYYLGFGKLKCGKTVHTEVRDKANGM